MLGFIFVLYFCKKEFAKNIFLKIPNFPYFGKFGILFFLFWLILKLFFGMDRKEIITDIADNIRILNYDKFDVKLVIEEFLRRIKIAVENGDEVALHEFGTFKNVRKPEKKLTTVVRIDRQPNKAPEALFLPERYIIAFVPSPCFKPRKMPNTST